MTFSLAAAVFCLGAIVVVLDCGMEYGKEKEGKRILQLTWIGKMDGVCPTVPLLTLIG